MHTLVIVLALFGLCGWALYIVTLERLRRLRQLTRPYTTVVDARVGFRNPPA
jgi:drug/metabolite transporter (DMT)-like permease